MVAWLLQVGLAGASGAGKTAFASKVEDFIPGMPSLRSVRDAHEMSEISEIRMNLRQAGKR